MYIPDIFFRTENKLHFFQSLQMSLDARVGQFSIHSPESIKFMEKIFADEFVLNTMKHGLRPEFTSEPGPYYEPNNKSCLDNLSIAQSKVEGWLKMGLLTEVNTRPYCCSPLTVSEKIDYLTGERKKRPCLDLSRHIYTFIGTSMFNTINKTQHKYNQYNNGR